MNNPLEFACVSNSVQVKSFGSRLPDFQKHNFSDTFVSEFLLENGLRSQTQKKCPVKKGTFSR